jgi:C4-dicarboxylate transporter DctM subunit
MDAFLWFAAFIGALLLFMATRTPVAVSMGVIGIVGTMAFVSTGALAQLANIAYTQTSSFVLVVAPLFILMGEVIAFSGMGQALFRAAALWLRRLPGGLGVATIAACTGFSAVCGSSPVTAATIGALSVPEMVKNGYDRRLALGATAAGGTLGILIPPSVPMILYGVITETSIGKLFLAGILPGLMMAALLALVIVARVLRHPEIAPRLAAPAPAAERWRALAAVGPVLLLAFFVIGSIYGGVATPTEAGAVGAAGAIAIAAAMGRMRRALLARSLENTVKTTAMFLLLLIGGLFSSFVLTRLGVPQGMSALLAGLEVRPWVIILFINLLLLVLGMFLDPMSILVIVVPIFLESVRAVGYDPIWFGVVVTIQIEIAAITPPVGFNLFVLKSVVPGIALRDVVSGSLTFVLPMLGGIALLVLFPEIALFLPRVLD